MGGPNYDLSAAWQVNINQVREKPLARKGYIKKLALRTGMSFEVLWHNYCTDDLAAAHFAKDPRKQNAHEKIAAEWIKKIPGVHNFQKLKPNGEKALYVYQGDILSAAGKQGIETPKSLDFAWDIVLPKQHATMSFYASHKHTGIDGGSQDNQFADLRHFTIEASALQQEKQIRFVSLADGEYYQKKRGSCGSKLNALQAIANQSKYTAAMTSAELPACIAACLKSMFDSLSQNKQAEIQTEFDALIERIHDYA